MNEKLVTTNRVNTAPSYITLAVLLSLITSGCASIKDILNPNTIKSTALTEYNKLLADMVEGINQGYHGEMSLDSILMQYDSAGLNTGIQNLTKDVGVYDTKNQKQFTKMQKKDKIVIRYDRPELQFTGKYGIKIDPEDREAAPIKIQRDEFTQAYVKGYYGVCSLIDENRGSSGKNKATEDAIKKIAKQTLKELKDVAKAVNTYNRNKYKAGPALRKGTLNKNK